MHAKLNTVRVARGLPIRDVFEKNGEIISSFEETQKAE